jgi:hypothetical protein
MSQSTLETDAVLSLISMKRYIVNDEGLDSFEGGVVRRPRRRIVSRAPILVRNPILLPHLSEQNGAVNTTTLPDPLDLPEKEFIDLRKLILIIYIRPDPATSVGAMIADMEWYSSDPTVSLAGLPRDMKSVCKFLLANNETRCGIVVKAENEEDHTSSCPIIVPDLTFLGNIRFSSLEISCSVKVASFSGLKCRSDVKIVRACCQRGLGVFSKLSFMDNLEEVWLDGSEVRKGFTFLNSHFLKVLSLSSVKPIGKSSSNTSLSGIHLRSIERLHIDDSWCSKLFWPALVNLKYLQISHDQIEFLPPAQILPMIQELCVVLPESMVSHVLNPADLPFASHLRSLRYPIVRYLKRV